MGALWRHSQTKRLLTQAVRRQRLQAAGRARSHRSAPVGQRMNALSGGWSYVARNKRRVALFSMASVGAAAALVYARRQYSAMTAAIDAERVSGARSLRAVYAASRRTVESTLRALLGPGRERVFACDASNPDALVARLKAMTDGAEKRETWELLKVTAIVRLVVSVYYIVAVYTVLLLQVNLVARYSTADVDAPIANLEGGRLELESKQRFLSVARRRLFEEGGIEGLVALVEQAAAEVVGPVRLTEKVGPDDVRTLLRRICRRVESRCGLRAGADDGLDGPADSVAAQSSDRQVLNASWLLTVPADGGSAHDGGQVCGSNVRLLVDECLDLCDVLDYDALVRTNVDALMDVAGGLVDASLWGVSSADGGGKVAFAPVIAKIANVSKTVLGTAERRRGSERLSLEACAPADVAGHGTQMDGPFVDALLQVASCDAFGAAVFLSGERSAASGN